MRIGSDFEKIKFDFYGFHLLEPNAFIGDVLLFLIAMFLVYKIGKYNSNSAFSKHFRIFLLLYSLSFFMGGLGHLLFNYWSIPGKYASWFGAFFVSYFVEKAMISLHPNLKTQVFLNKISMFKLLGMILLEIVLLINVDISNDPSIGLIFPALNSTIGLGFSLGILGYYFQKKIDGSFKYLWMSTLVALPSLPFQSLKINIHPWFDRNDFSHLLLVISLLFYWKFIDAYYRKAISPVII